MIFAMLYRRSHFDQISVRIIKAYDFLSPTVRHEFVDIFHFRVTALKLFHKSFYVTFFKIELARIILRKNLLAEKLFPVFLFLKNQTFRQDHISVIVKDHFKTKQIMIELFGSLDILNYNQYVFQFHRFPFFKTNPDFLPNAVLSHGYPDHNSFILQIVPNRMRDRSFHQKCFILVYDNGFFVQKHFCLAFHNNEQTPYASAAS